MSFYSVSSPFKNTPISEAIAKDLLLGAPSPELADTSAILINPDDGEDEELITPYQKRKRASINYNVDDALRFEGMRGSANTSAPIIKRPKTQSKPKIRGVIIGVWCDSSEPEDVDKHVIYGFIDVHDRLRTRIYGMNRRREELIGNLPMGAGGCWVTFSKIIFDAHLKELSAIEVKEYVKLRASDLDEPASDERQEELDASAVARAKVIVASGTASPGGKPIVHRPFGRKSSSRQSLPPQALHRTPSFQAVNSPNDQATKGSFYDGKPKGVLLGYWIDSDSAEEADKHAMYGVLSGSDCFRIKVQRVTRDGRYVDGNFPVGAGSMWMGYEKVVFEPHLAPLTRPEIKEYARIRLISQDTGETDKERKVNEAWAITEAKVIVARDSLNDKPGVQKALPPLEMETRGARLAQKVHARHQVDADGKMERARKEKNEASERQHNQVRKEIAVNEASIQSAVQHQLKSNIRKLNEIWGAQQNVTNPHASGNAAPPRSDEVKYHHGIKYEKRENGFFQGKLVSTAQILTIDGEDYVEYRILTKPSL